MFILNNHKWRSHSSTYASTCAFAIYSCSSYLNTHTRSWVAIMSSAPSTSFTLTSFYFTPLPICLYSTLTLSPPPALSSSLSLPHLSPVTRSQRKEIRQEANSKKKLQSEGCICMRTESGGNSAQEGKSTRSHMGCNSHFTRTHIWIQTAAVKQCNGRISPQNSH